MSRYLLFLSVIVVVLSPFHCFAAEQVTLKSGTRLIGIVSVADKTVTVKIGDSVVTVPMSDVDLIGPVGTDAQQTPQRLLMIALESRLQRGTGEGQVGLLAEAYRQDQDDARIAYWYAQNLLDAGFGSAAQKILEEKRDAIEETYPGMADRLVDQIQERIGLENLPARLITRLDRLNKAIPNAPLNSDRLPMFVRFRVIDQNGKPIDKSAIRIDCNGQDERLEGFDGGYFLFTYNSYRNNDESNCRLHVNWPGLEPKEFELRPAADHVEDAGELVVTRFDEKSKMPFKVVVVDRNDKLISGATVTLRPEVRNDNRSPETTARTDDKGRAEILAFPMNYSYTVAAKGFKSEGGAVELKSDSKEHEEQRVELYPVMSGSVRLAWTTTGLQGDGAVTNGEATLPFGEGENPMRYGPDSVTFLRPQQVKDRLTLQSGPPYFGPMMGGASSWVRRVPQELLKNSPQEYFAGIDLKKIDALQDEFEQVESERTNGPSQYTPLAFAAKQGEVFVGKVPGRDMRNGQPTLVSFKVYVEKVSTAP